jgi:hypothetical protein
MESLPHDMQFPVEAVLVVIQNVWREEPRCRELDSVGVTDCRDCLLKFAFEYFGQVKNVSSTWSETHSDG